MGIVYGDSINEAMDNLTLVYTEETIKEVNLSYIENTCCGVLTFNTTKLPNGGRINVHFPSYNQ